MRNQKGHFVWEQLKMMISGSLLLDYVLDFYERGRWCSVFFNS